MQWNDVICCDKTAAGLHYESIYLGQHHWLLWHSLIWLSASSAEKKKMKTLNYYNLGIACVYLFHYFLSKRTVGTGRFKAGFEAGGLYSIYIFVTEVLRFHVYCSKVKCLRLWHANSHKQMANIDYFFRFLFDYGCLSTAGSRLQCEYEFNLLRCVWACRCDAGVD